MLKENFIEKARNVHGNRFDYSKVEYVNNHTKVCIIDNENNEEFWQTPANHLRGQGNPSKRYEKISKKLRLTQEQFIEKAKQVHGNKYDYSKVVYINNRTKVCIICPKHGEFWQSPDKHLQGRGCRNCQYESLKILKPYTTEYFIKKSKSIHGDKYDYSKSVYINNHTEVVITCPIHGDFKQLPIVHYKGCGCQKCGNSILEQEIQLFLEQNSIKYVYEKTFDWLKYNKKQTLDFYLPDYNLAIECQGEQHYKPVKFFGGEYKYQITILRDENKKMLCKNNGINLIYFTHINNNEFICDTVNTVDEIFEILNKKNRLINSENQKKEIK